MKKYWKHSLVMLSLAFVGAAFATANAQDGERGPRGPRDGGERREGGGRPEGGPRQFDPEQMIERIMQLDKDKDGKLSKEEVGESRLAAMFERGDTDKDGSLTKDELKAAFTRGPGDRPGPRDGDRPGPPRDGERGPRGPRDGEAGPRGPRDGEGRPGGMGPGGPMGGGFQMGMVLPGFLMERLGLSEEQRRDVHALQQENEKRLNEILTEDQKAKLKGMSGPRPGFGGPMGFQRPGGDRPEGREGFRRPGGDRPEGAFRGPRDGERGPRGPRDGDHERDGDKRDGDKEDKDD